MLEVGFSRVDITPQLGVNLQGYYYERHADGILDPLYTNVIAVSDGQRTAALLSLDLIGLQKREADRARKVISERTGIPEDAILLCATHTHTGPAMSPADDPDPIYNKFVYMKLGDAVALALADRSEAKLSYAANECKNISFIRRYRMKDGSVRTNPGRRNPQIDRPIGSPDETVQLLKIERRNKPEILLVNFQVHPDVIGGCKFSADYPGFVRSTLESCLPGVRAVYINGAQGDTNHTDVNCPEWDENSGYAHAIHMGRSIAGSVLQIYGKTKPIDSDTGVRYAHRDVQVPSSRVGADEIREAEKIIALHEAGRDCDIPEKGMGVVTLVAEAYRMKRLENGPDFFDLSAWALSFGGFAIAGVPGEPFTEIGRRVKATSPFEATFFACLTNGSEGYLPTANAYEEGGYEARSSRFRSGVAEILIRSAQEALAQIRE